MKPASGASGAKPSKVLGFSAPGLPGAPGSCPHHLCWPAVSSGSGGSAARWVTGADAMDDGNGEQNGNRPLLTQPLCPPCFVRGISTTIASSLFHFFALRLLCTYPYNIVPYHTARLSSFLCFCFLPSSPRSFLALWQHRSLARLGPRQRWPTLGPRYYAAFAAANDSRRFFAGHISLRAR